MPIRLMSILHKKNFELGRGVRITTHYAVSISLSARKSGLVESSILRRCGRLLMTDS